MFHMEQYRLRRSSVLIISGFDKLNIEIQGKTKTSRRGDPPDRKLKNLRFIALFHMEHSWSVSISRWLCGFSPFYPCFRCVTQRLCVTYVLLFKRSFGIAFYDLSVWVARFTFILWLLVRLICADVRCVKHYKYRNLFIQYLHGRCIIRIGFNIWLYSIFYYLSLLFKLNISLPFPSMSICRIDPNAFYLGFSAATSGSLVVRNRLIARLTILLPYFSIFI